VQLRIPVLPSIEMSVFKQAILSLLVSAFVFVSGAIAQESPPKNALDVAQVDRGKLVIAGGGSLPAAVYREFLRLAGDQPNLIVVPTASTRQSALAEVKKLWSSRGFESVQVLHTRDREEASKPEFVAPIRSANAIWFNGGSQQRIADAYVGTIVEKEVYALLKRGGVVGGSSAGAAIQSRVMIAGGRKDPELSVGLDLLSGTILDQHFLRRDRITRLMAAVKKHPDLIGLGIDEGTAVVVEQSKAKVVGDSYVLRIEIEDNSPKVHAFNAGESIPLPALIQR